MIAKITARLGLTPVSMLISIGIHALVVVALTAGMTFNHSPVQDNSVEEVMAFSVAFEDEVDLSEGQGQEAVEAVTKLEQQGISAVSQDKIDPMPAAVPIEKKSVVAKKVSHVKVVSEEKSPANITESIGSADTESQRKAAAISSQAANNTSLSAWINRHKFYPADARRRGEEGTVLVRINVNQIGELESFQVVKSSGSRTLDRAAAEIIKRSAPYPDEFSQLSVSAEIPLTFTLQS